MTRLTKFGEEFLKLALRIDKHIKGYVDFYIGPSNFRQIIDNESKLSPSRLLKDVKALLSQLENQGYDNKREQYLSKLLVAMKTSIERILGIEIPFGELFLKLYDIELKPISETELNNLKEEFNNAYSGPGTLKDILADLRIRRRVSIESVYNFFNKALDIVKSKTLELFNNLLPQKEHIIIDLVENVDNNKAKWSYYNWYLGDYCSRIQINPNYDMFWTTLLSSSAHEGYPGHHMEFVIKEHLYHESNQFENSILLLNSPKIIISEGIATLAINVLFSYEKHAEISLNEFCLDKLNEDPIEKLAKQLSLKRKINMFWQNIGFYALIEEWSESKLYRYANSYEIFSNENIINQIALLKNPVYSTTTFSYNLGSNIIVSKYGEFPSIKSFTNLLKNPVLPSDLVK